MIPPSESPTQSWRPHLWFLPLILIVIPLWLATQFTTPVPRADHWSMVIEPYLKVREGSTILEAVRHRFNDSRMDLPTSIHQLLIRYTGWNLWLESTLCGLLAAVTAWLLLRELKVFAQNEWWPRLLPWVAVWWVLSPRQWMNWSWGIQICYALVVLLTLLTLVFLRSSLPRWSRVALAAAMATGACFTFINGWLAWVLGAGYLLWDWQRNGWQSRDRAFAFGSWIAMAGLLAWL